LITDGPQPESLYEYGMQLRLLVGELALRDHFLFPQKSGGGLRYYLWLGVSAVSFLQCFDTVSFVTGRAFDPITSVLLVVLYYETGRRKPRGNRLTQAELEKGHWWC